MRHICISNYAAPDEVARVWPGATGFVVCEHRPLMLGIDGVLWYGNCGTLFDTYEAAVNVVEKSYEYHESRGHAKLEYFIFGVKK